MLDELNTYTLQELYKQPIEPIPWAVKDLLAPGLYFLGGSPKVGKSWLALQLCLAVCRGEPFLGFHTRKSEVLYLALEDGPRRLHSRALHLTEEAPLRSAPLRPRTPDRAGAGAAAGSDAGRASGHPAGHH